MAFHPEKIARSNLLTLSAKIAYGCLLRYAGQDGMRNPVKTLSKEIAVSKRSPQDYLEDLVRIGLIRRAPRISDDRQTSNEYILNKGFPDVEQYERDPFAFRADLAELER